MFLIVNMYLSYGFFNNSMVYFKLYLFFVDINTRKYYLNNESFIKHYFAFT